MPFIIFIVSIRILIISIFFETQITKEEIQKSYGGGTRTMYYSGVYRSSTNAYMLMYRQIDPERNTNPMEAKDFPPHIKVFIFCWFRVQ